MSKKGPWVLYDGELWTRAELDAHRYHEAQKVRSTAVKAYVKPQRGRFVMRNGQLVEWTPAPAAPRSAGPQIVRDMEPYQAVGLPGAPWIKGGRREHREMLRRHNKIEVGNEFNGAKVERREPVTVPGYSAKQHLADLIYGRRPLTSD